MGSGSSKPPTDTQSAPPTARATPKQVPKRNRQFEEVQIANQGGNTPRSRQQQQRPTGTTPSQAPTRTSRGQDPGASGSTSERSSRQQPPTTNRQGAAANGRKPQSQQNSTNMPAQQGQISSGNLHELMEGLNTVDRKRHAGKLNVVQEESELADNDVIASAGSVEPGSRMNAKKTPGTSVTSKQANQITAGLGGSQQRNQNKTTPVSEPDIGNKTKSNPAGKAAADKRTANNKAERGEPADKKTRELQKTNDKSGRSVVGKNGSAADDDNNRNAGASSNGFGAKQDGINGKTKPNKTPVSKQMEDDLSIDYDADNISYDKGDEGSIDDHQQDMEDWNHTGQQSSQPASNQTANRNQPTASMQRAKTSLSMKDDDLVFETFYHRSGKEFQCIYQSGMRFYLDDWGSKEWQPFPKRWYNEGLLVTNTILKDDNADPGRSDQGAASQSQSTSRSQGRSQGGSSGGGNGGGNDDREGFLMHPSKGRVPTYIFYKKHNVHMYYDRDTGGWVRMPIGWELHHSMVKSLVDQVEEAVPTWGDRHDILSLLRACNYDPDECISIYLHLEKDEWMKAPKTSKDNRVLMEKEARILDLEKRVKHLESQLQKEINNREEAERNLEEQMNKFSELEAESKETEAHLSAVTGGRPVSARPFSRMVKAGQKPGKGVKGGAVGGVIASKTSSNMEAVTEEDEEKKDVKSDDKKEEKKSKKEGKKDNKDGKKDGSKVKVKVVEVIKEVIKEIEPQKDGEVVNPDDVLDLNANAKELRKAHTRVKMDVERYMGDMKHMMEKLAPAIKQLKSSEKGTQNEIEEVRALYRKEALQRKLLYNQLQELRGNIRVFCRVRKDDRAECCMRFPSDQDIVVQHPQQGKKIFSFDKVFEPNSSQDQVFEDTKPIISSCVDGYNVCLLAYGQTGSGKTFTMMGPESNPGINIRAMKELFQVCAERTETMEYDLKVSLVEIYNETIQDLLTNDVKTLELRTAGNKVQIPGLIEYPIKNIDDVKKVMGMGDKNRSVASTKMNSTSSRSHLVLMLNVEGRDKVTGAISRGSLVLCDLAGSERIAKTEAEGQRLVEAAAINKSLSALGQVFTALRSSQLHVPYRNSKLTQILQPSLGGDAKACLFVNASPDAYNFAESVSTLTFGSNARQVTLGQAKQNITKGK